MVRITHRTNRLGTDSLPKKKKLIKLSLLICMWEMAYWSLVRNTDCFRFSLVIAGKFQDISSKLRITISKNILPSLVPKDFTIWRHIIWGNERVIIKHWINMTNQCKRRAISRRTAEDVQVTKSWKLNSDVDESALKYYRQINLY
jgi:hypothetical protein